MKKPSITCMEKDLASTLGTPFEGFGPAEWALEFIKEYGGISNPQFKAWVLDQVVRVLKGATVNVHMTDWSNGDKDYHFYTTDPPEAYFDWVAERNRNYEYDPGTYQ